MNSRFYTALTTKDELTENLMPTHSTSGSYLVDFFFKIGAARGLSPVDLVTIFSKSFSENPLLTLKTLFYNRNIRGIGQGERRSFRILFNYLCTAKTDLAYKNLQNVPLFGRWDDLFSGLNTPLEKDILNFYATALLRGDKLAAKWAPRENKSLKEIALRLMKFMDLTPKQYRILLSRNTEVVETLMCNKKWDEIKYSGVPSVAMSKYKKAFSRNDAERYVAYLKAVEKGEAKINASAIFPHTVLKDAFNYSPFNPLKLTQQEILAINTQWYALPDFMPKNKYILPICDVSGSMNGEPLEVCVSLGIYLSERNIGPFKDMFITFSRRPTLELIKGNNVVEKVYSLSHAYWEGNTDIEAAFKLILNKAVQNKLSQEDLPDTLLILSDMQFDQCVVNSSDSAMEMFKRMYAEHNYKLPQLIFWNLRTSFGVPVKVNESGVCLISGFSPSILMGVFNGEMTPMNIVLESLNNKIFDCVTL